VDNFKDRRDSLEVDYHSMPLANVKGLLPEDSDIIRGIESAIGI
jgi:hypothetical protein